MPKLQYSIRMLLACVLVLAVALAALSSGSYLWTAAVTTLTIFVLVSAALGAIVRSDTDRACWIGFALFGWTHFGLVMVPTLRDQMGVWLWTTMPVQWIQAYQLQRGITWSAIPPGAFMVERFLGVNRTDWVRLSDFVPTGQAGGASSAVKTLTISDPRVVSATVRPGEPETIDFVAGRRPGGADVITTDALGRTFVFRIVVYGDADSTQKTWDSITTLLAGLIGGVTGHFLSRRSTRERLSNDGEPKQS